MNAHIYSRIFKLHTVCLKIFIIYVFACDICIYKYLLYICFIVFHIILKYESIRKHDICEY